MQKNVQNHMVDMKNMPNNMQYNMHKIYNQSFYSNVQKNTKIENMQKICKICKYAKKLLSFADVSQWHVIAAGPGARAASGLRRGMPGPGCSTVTVMVLARRDGFVKDAS